MTEKNFTNRVVLVTGASAGVGEATARAFVEAGAYVIVAARGVERLQQVADDIGATAIAADVSSKAGCKHLINQAIVTHGYLDVLVNNAGCHRRGPVVEREADELGEMVDTNLRAPLMLSRLALDALAEELAGTSVTVSAVSPGPIATDFILGDIDAVSDITFSQAMSTPEQIAELVLACAADGRVERSRPALSRIMATAGYLMPGLPRALRPLLAAKGRRAKQRYRRGPPV